MAIVQFKYGSGALPSTKNSGALYLNQYNKKFYVDLDESNRICVGDFQRINWTSSATIDSPRDALKALTIKDNNILYLTHDTTTGHDALWYYDDQSTTPQFREIISSESISIIASEFDRVDKTLTSLGTELTNLTTTVGTKVSKAELEAYDFATEEEAAAFAITAISNVQGDATNDTSATLTIQGTRKYVDFKAQEINSTIKTLNDEVDEIEESVADIADIVNDHTTQISSVSQVASGAADTAGQALTKANDAADAADKAKTLATDAGTAAKNAADLAAQKVTMTEVENKGYITEDQSNVAIANASNALVGSSGDNKDKNTIYGAKAYATSLDSAMTSRVNTIDNDVKTKVSKAELEAYDYATNDEAASYALSAISNIQGNSESDTLETLTIHGTRKYVDSKIQGVDTNIKALDNKIDGVDGKVTTLSSTVSDHTTQISDVSQIASDAADTAGKALTKANDAADAADKAKTLATEAKTAAQNAADIAGQKVTMTEVENKGYITENQANKAIADASSALTGSSTDTSHENTIWGAKKYADSLNSSMDTRVDTVADNVEKNAEEIETLKGQISGLSNSGFATTGYVDQKATSTLNSAKGTANDSAETITIYGARKYADAINTSLTTKINSVGNSLSALDLLVDGISKDLKQTDGTATQAKEAANKANQDLVGVKTTAEGAATSAAEALTAANTAQKTADGKTTLQAVINYLSEGQYTTVPAVTELISDATDSTIEYIDDEVLQINTDIDTLKQNIGNLSNIMNFIGTITENLSQGSTTRTVTVNGSSYTAQKGDVVIDSGTEEFVFDGSKWQLIGNITAETAAISDLQGRMSSAEELIDNLHGYSDDHDIYISDLQGRMTDAESNITTINDTIGTTLTHDTNTLWGVLTWGTW